MSRSEVLVRSHFWHMDWRFKYSFKIPMAAGAPFQVHMGRLVSQVVWLLGHVVDQSLDGSRTALRFLEQL